MMQYSKINEIPGQQIMSMSFQDVELALIVCKNTSRSGYVFYLVHISHSFNVIYVSELSFGAMKR